MKRFSELSIGFIVCASLVLLLGCGQSSSIEIVEKSDNQIDIMVDGKLFTSYRMGLNDEKPIFFPVNSPQWQMLTRGWPFIEGIPDEKQDHVHHQGLSYTYGDVNGLDFWAEPKDSTRNGKIVHQKVAKAEAKGDAAVLQLLADWQAPDGTVLLKEDKTVKFHVKANSRTMDFDITLTAADQPVHFGDTKEGFFAIRVTPQLKDANDGEYINSNGLRTAKECWGKRAEWMALRGPVKEENIVLAFFIHPSSQNFPPYWHARDYGLFTANPFGRKMYTNGAEEPLEMILHPGESMQFKARVMIYSGTMTEEALKQAYEDYKQMP
ncbi:PmoA family protein [candidate division KSB1 bacterium]|nr:PmoA family protein [candidate division KSB1 bacterium]